MFTIIIGLLIGIGIAYLLYLLISFIGELLDTSVLLGVWPVLVIVILIIWLIL